MGRLKCAEFANLNSCSSGPGAGGLELMQCAHALDAVRCYGILFPSDHCYEGFVCAKFGRLGVIRFGVRGGIVLA